MLLAGTLVTLVYAVLLLFDFDTGAAGLQYVTDDAWIPDLGVRYTLGVDGLNLWLIALTALISSAVGAVDRRAAGRSSARACSPSTWASRRRRCSARSSRRTCCSSSSSST